MTGLYFEDLEVGREFEHGIRRTVTETDNLLFSTMTHNPQPLHLDAEFARQSQHGQILVNSYFTLALLVGISVGETTVGTTIGNLGMERVEFPNPVFIGDTLRGRTRIVDRRESKSRPDRGVVWFEHVALNQRDEIVCECIRKGMMLKKPEAVS
ncbi:MAG: MaoC family dehydratase [Gammaproteobacteria bacterium]|nr:MaoC family dehydratase [Gammaproteobacteria bacterium]